MESSYMVPVAKQIVDQKHSDLWHASKSYDLLIGFITRCNNCIVGKKISDAPAPSSMIQSLLDLLQVCLFLRAFYCELSRVFTILF